MQTPVDVIFVYVLVKVLLSQTLYSYSYAVPVGLKMQGIFKLTGIRPIIHECYKILSASSRIL